MKKLILNTLFVLGTFVLLVTPSAHADRQGGGGLKVVALKSMNFANVAGRSLKLSERQEWVRYKVTDGKKVSFEYAWTTGTFGASESVALERENLEFDNAEIVRALLRSKNSLDWEVVVRDEAE